MKTYKILLIFCLLPSGYARAETYTLETYYPSPVGVYTNLTVSSSVALSKDGGYVGIGGAPSTATKLQVKGNVNINGVVVPGSFAADPVAPEQNIEGAIYFNTTSKKHRVFQNASWNDLGGGGILKTGLASGAYHTPFTYTAANGTIPVSLMVYVTSNDNFSISLNVRWRDAAGAIVRDWTSFPLLPIDTRLMTIPFFTNANRIDFMNSAGVQTTLIAYTYY